MVFSFFGKKDPPPKPASKAMSRPAARPVEDRAAPNAPAPAARPNPVAPAPPRSAVPPPQPVPKAAPTADLDAKKPQEELPSLDFTSSASFSATQSEIASNIALQESSDQVHPAVEEAAILYANGNDSGCQAVLEAACQRSDLGNSAEQVWTMLFEIYQVLDRRDAFESKAIDYVVRFERSPPPWRGRDEALASAGVGTTQMVSLGTVLDAGAAKHFEMVARLFAKNPTVRLDVGKLRETDDEGCTLFVACLRAARKDKRELIVQNAASLARVLEAKVEVGKREHEDVWLLLLEMHQQQGSAEQYEEWALNYAITFEVSPPAWEPPKVKPRAAASSAAQPLAAQVPDDAFAMSGELSGPCLPLMQKLKDHASQREALVIDLSELKRMDFVCAGNLLNTLFESGAGGKRIRLTNVSALVAALLRVVGIAEAATVERRRI